MIQHTLAQRIRRLTECDGNPLKRKKLLLLQDTLKKVLKTMPFYSLGLHDNGYWRRRFKSWREVYLWGTLDKKGFLRFSIRPEGSSLADAKLLFFIHRQMRDAKLETHGIQLPKQGDRRCETYKYSTYEAMLASIDKHRAKLAVYFL